MKVHKAISLLPAIGLLALASTANAQTDLTCDDISFSGEILERAPDIKNSCLAVVENEAGERFAKLNVELIRTRMNGATFRFKHADGTFGPSQSISLDPSWRAEIGGRQYRIRELSRGQELSIYMPADRWVAHITAADAMVTTYTMSELTDDDGSADGSAAAAAGGGAAMASLPSTAGPMPLFALFGALALGAAGLIRILRR